MEGVGQEFINPLCLSWGSGWLAARGAEQLLQALSALLCSRGHPGASQAPARLPSLRSGLGGHRWPLHRGCTHRARGEDQFCVLGWASSPGPLAGLGWGALWGQLGLQCLCSPPQCLGTKRLGWQAGGALWDRRDPEVGVQTLEMDNQGFWTEVSGFCIPWIIFCAWELVFLQLTASPISWC